ncbi:hypothetical protein Patl1_24438 [Pistacia atlantica]|uniref:Uncharacterized protein n=1 Tax=Pistacia atlantica TaxID=434234 RepID=A0ACC0ZUM2_9ROSI|nr:hypothetical protein Patl1_24438 [Pistacia atlantica]
MSRFPSMETQNSAHNIMLVELKKLIESNPLFRDKLRFPAFKSSQRRTLINQRCAAARFFANRAYPPLTNNPLVGPIPKAGAFPPIGAQGTVVSPSSGAVTSWMSNNSPSLPHPAVATGGVTHPPKSNVMSMDFHPYQQTILLVGTKVGDVSYREVGSRERLAHKSFKVWDISAASRPLQFDLDNEFNNKALLNDAAISVNQCVWGPDGLILVCGAFSKHIVQIYTSNPTGELRQHLKIDAYVGGVNDNVFTHPNKQLCMVTCGDDKTIKVWDAVAGCRQYTFEGHESPVYSAFTTENIQLGYMIAWDLDWNYDAPVHWCTMMAYTADGTSSFSCGTSKDGESHLVEWNESEGAIKRTYSGWVVRFDTTWNQFLAAGDEFQIKFWDMDNTNMLTAVDADGGLPVCSRTIYLYINVSYVLLSFWQPLIVNALGPVGNVSGAIAPTLEQPDRVPQAVSISSLKIPDVSDPSQIKALHLPDSIAPGKVGGKDFKYLHVLFQLGRNPSASMVLLIFFAELPNVKFKCWNASLNLHASELCMWSIDKWEKLKSRCIQEPAGCQSPSVGETKVQFHNDQTHLLVAHDRQISIYDSKLECSSSWSPNDTLPAPISSAVYSCDGFLVYSGFCDGAVGVCDAGNLRLRCRIAASAYIPCFSVR